jgi:hypothetical protein
LLIEQAGVEKQGMIAWCDQTGDQGNRVKRLAE